MINALILAGIILAPVQSLRQAELKYGKLTKDYQMVDRNKWIVKFDPTIFGAAFKKPMWINKDILIPMVMVFNELQATGLIKELTINQGCFASRPIRGTNRPSIHAYGLGCDFNHKKFSKEFVDVWKRWGFTWGGDWCQYKDCMHMSFGWESGDCPYYEESTPKNVKQDKRPKLK